MANQNKLEKAWIFLGYVEEPNGKVQLTWKCPKCGRLSRDQVFNYCPHCGEKLYLMEEM